MHGMKNHICLLAAAAATVFSAMPPASAAVKFASPFADGMILQRDARVAVWGTADPAEKVTVSFAGQTAVATADAEGRWLVRLEPMSASKEGRVLRANDAKIEDVLVGEVWFCCGQSNTELPLVGGSPHFRDREGLLLSAITNLKFVRCVYASDYKWSVKPRMKAAYPVKWRAFTPENLGKGPSFSAMGVYFAIALYNALDVPVGIVGSYWGGTNIDAWTPREGYEGAPESLRYTSDYPVVEAGKWTAECKKGPVGSAHQQPTVLWNEMVAPWCPMAMRGFIWYQGCHNSGAGEAQNYCDKMHALYRGWAKKFENPDLKLYFVQLAPFSCSWWDIQLQQAKFAAEEKNAGMVVSADIGNNSDIHPADKGPLGRRLAALALNRDYGFAGLVADSPVCKSARTEGDTLVLSFDHADGWYVYNADWSTNVPFEVAGDDGAFKPAVLVNLKKGAKRPNGSVAKPTGVVEGADLVLRAEGVAVPKKARYLYNRPWNGNVFAKSGLPLGPFVFGD